MKQQLRKFIKLITEQKFSIFDIAVLTFVLALMNTSLWFILLCIPFAVVSAYLSVMVKKWNEEWRVDE